MSFFTPAEAAALAGTTVRVGTLVDFEFGSPNYDLEMLANGDFASADGWTTGAQWSIGSGVATKTSGAAESLLQRSFPFVPGRSYAVTFDLTRYVGGSVRPRFVGVTAVLGTLRSAVGTYTEILTAQSGNHTFAMSGTAAFDGDIDNVSIKEITAPMYLWNGFGNLPVEWRIYIGVGDLGQIEGLEEARNPVSQQVTFTLSAVGDSPLDTLAVALEETGLVQGRLAVVSLQLFDADWQRFGDPIPIYFGIMQPPRVTRTAMSATGGAQRVLTLSTENLFFGRHRPAAGRYTDREQQARYLGDKFCEYVSQLIHKNIVWPAF